MEVKIKQGRCSTCGRELPEESFYPSDKYRCKECHRKQKRESYNRCHPERFVNEKGKLMQRQGKRPVIYWNGNMISILTKYFPNTTNTELVELLGVSERTIIRKARELGICKSKEFISRVSREHSLMGCVAKKRVRR